TERDRVRALDAFVAQVGERRRDHLRIALVVVRQRQLMAPAALEDPPDPSLGEAFEDGAILGERGEPRGLHDRTEVRVLRAALDRVHLGPGQPERNVDLDERLSLPEPRRHALPRIDVAGSAAPDGRHVPAQGPREVDELAAGERAPQRPRRLGIDLGPRPIPDRREAAQQMIHRRPPYLTAPRRSPMPRPRAVSPARAPDASGSSPPSCASSIATIEPSVKRY